MTEGLHNENLNDDVSADGLSRILVVIPAYNEAASLPPLIRALAAEPMPVPWVLDLLVVSDGSTDNTAQAITGLPARLLQLPCNLGVGGAVQTGLQYAVRHGYRYALQVDGDGQHPPNQIPRLIEKMAEGAWDMVLGSRFLDPGGFQSSVSRRLGIRFFSLILSAQCGQRFTDTTSGFRMWGRRAIELLAREYPEGYPEVEAVLMLHYAGMRMAEVSVEMASRAAGQSSIGLWQMTSFLVKVPLALVMGVVRRGKHETQVGRS
jgi:glycosyltransferase involved in cell wall biosynthesis